MFSKAYDRIISFIKVVIKIKVELNYTRVTHENKQLPVKEVPVKEAISYR